METKFITEKDKTALLDFFRHYVPHFAFRPNAPLYHYTTGENLIRILETNELWTTQIACLNDEKELTYAVEEFQKRIAARSSAQHSPDLDPLLLHFEQFLSLRLPQGRLKYRNNQRRTLWLKPAVGWVPTDHGSRKYPPAPPHRSEVPPGVQPRAAPDPPPPFNLVAGASRPPTGPGAALVSRLKHARCGAERYFALLRKG